MNHQLSVNFTNYYAGIKFGSLVYGMPNEKFKNISLGLQYLNYGDFKRADEFGNVTGTFSAGEYALAVLPNLQHEKLRLGSTLKGCIPIWKLILHWDFWLTSLRPMN